MIGAAQINLKLTCSKPIWYSRVVLNTKKKINLKLNKTFLFVGNCVVIQSLLKNPLKPPIRPVVSKPGLLYQSLYICAVCHITKCIYNSKVKSSLKEMVPSTRNSFALHYFTRYRGTIFIQAPPNLSSSTVTHNLLGIWSIHLSANTATYVNALLLKAKKIPSNK